MEKIKIEVTNTNLTLQDKRQIEIIDMNQKEEHNSVESMVLFSPNKWVFITPPKQKLVTPQLEPSAIETSIICIENDGKQLYALKPSYKNNTFISSENKIAIDNKFVHLGNFKQNSDIFGVSIPQQENHEIPILYSDRQIKLEEPSTSRVIRRPTKPYLRPLWSNVTEYSSRDLNKIKMDIADICLDNSQDYSFIPDDDGFEVSCSDTFKRKNTEDFVIRKKSRRCQ